MLHPNKHKIGAITLELLMAFAIFTLNITAVILVINGGQSVSIDTETNTEALMEARNMLEDARLTSQANFDSLYSDSYQDTIGSLTYTKNLNVVDQTPCKKIAVSSVAWLTPPIRQQKVELETLLTNLEQSLALGGDCYLDPPETDWLNPQLFASDSLLTGQPTTIEIFNKIAYIGTDQAPFLSIANINNVSEGQTTGIFSPFLNSFNLGAEPNNIDAIKWIDASGVQKIFAFFAMNTPNHQLKVVDVTDLNNPILVANKSLSTCVAGSAPQGWRLYVYKDKLYFLTRYTAGPEFHIFDISNPSNPSEIGNGVCNGFELGSTAESIEVRDQKVGTSTYRFVYLATDQDSKELRVLDVTSATSINEVVTSNQDLPGIQDGESLYLTGNKLYFGRRSTPPGPDLYVFNISNPNTGLPVLGSADIGTSVLGIKVLGDLAFLATTRANKQFQIWNVADLSNISLVKELNSGYFNGNSIDYESGYVYGILQAVPNFKIFYDKKP